MLQVIGGYPQDIADARPAPRPCRGLTATAPALLDRSITEAEWIMTVTITPGSPLSAESRVLIAASQEALLEVFEADEIFSFTAEDLASPDITFLVARDDSGAPLGCVAMVDCRDYVEVKRLYVAPKGRRRGVAHLLMEDLEQRARDTGHQVVRLETGDALVAAVQFYTTLGYAVRGPFGDYADHPASLFMEKQL